MTRVMHMASKFRSDKVCLTDSGEVVENPNYNLIA